MKDPKTLEDWREIVRQNAPLVDRTPYAHNIIGIALSAIDKLAGEAETKKTIKEFGLDKKG
jgi:hypothetical protein